MTRENGAYDRLVAAFREHRRVLNLEDRLVIRNPDGDDQFCEEMALLAVETLTVDAEAFIEAHPNANVSAWLRSVTANAD